MTDIVAPPPPQAARVAANDAAAAHDVAEAAVFAGDSEMARRCRALDWAATPLGPVDAWPPSLRTIVATVLATGFAAIVLWGPALVQLYNDGYVPFLGVKHPAGLGQPTHACWPELRDVTAPLYARVLAGETVTLHEQRFPLQRHGPDAPPDDVAITLSYAPVRDEQGRVGGILVTLFDVTAHVAGRAAETERARLLAEAAADRERLRAFIRHVPAPVALHLGPEHRYAIVSDAFRTISGGRDVTGMTPREAYPEAAGQGILERFDEVLATGRPWVAAELPLRIDRRGTGVEDTWFDVRYEPVRDAAGHVVGVLNFSRDATDQVRARRQVEAQARALASKTAELEVSRDRLRLALDAAGMAYWDFDPTANTTVRSEHHDRLYGHAAPLAVWNFDTYLAHVHPDDRAFVADRFTRALRDEADWHLESRVVWADGSVHWIHTQGKVFRDRDGAPRRVVGVIADVTARKHAEAERERLYEAAEASRREAEAANRAKSEFLAVMSHELRTPLNAIGGYAELLELGIRGPISEPQREDLGRIRRAQRHLLGLINGVLNYARVEAGAVHYQLEDVPLDEVLATCEALVAPQARAKGLVLRCDAPPPHLRVPADREKLQQVVLNLLSNAVKFTEPGGRVTLAGAAAGGAVRVTVDDTGVGIAADQLARAFEPFVQLDATLTRARDGTGLGLAISRDLARGMGGDLTAQSAVGVGRTFTLTVPAA